LETEFDPTSHSIEGNVLLFLTSAGKHDARSKRISMSIQEFGALLRTKYKLSEIVELGLTILMPASLFLKIKE
jgi:hypothetical protein